MARRSLLDREEEDIELNMTPMLDVVFILLIFFIVTAVFVKEPGVEITRPETANLEDLRPMILVAISADDEIWVNKRLVERADLIPTLQALRAENPKAEAIVQGDATARFSVVYDVMTALQEVGVPNQFISTDPR